MGFDPLGKQISRLRISDHGYDEMSDENIFAKEVLAGVFEGIVVEDYPSYGKGPCVLVLQKDLNRSTWFGEFRRIFVTGGCRDRL
jgi:hypothetical protein